MNDTRRRNKIIRKLFKKRHGKSKPVIKLIPQFETIVDNYNFVVKNSIISQSRLFNSIEEYNLYIELIKDHNKEINKANKKIFSYYYEIEKLQNKLENFELREKEKFMLEEELVIRYLNEISKVTDCWSPKDQELIKKLLIELIKTINK
jgi:hypothetical protein